MVEKNGEFIKAFEIDELSLAFCSDFIYSDRPKFVFGRNHFATAIAAQVDIDGFIDEFTGDTEFCSKPIVKLADLPVGGMVVSTVVLAKPQTVMKKLKSMDIESIDYYKFRKYSKLKLPQVLFGDEDIFENEYNLHKADYDAIFSKLKDEQSKDVMSSIFNFRISSDLSYLDEFKFDIEKQYFEDILNLRLEGETFLDVGCFDGFTSLEFIARCPKYKSLHVFEPEKSNMEVIMSKMANFENINYHNFGLSDEEKTLKFFADGSASRISEDGTDSIHVRPLDDLNLNDATFIKMDIEGGEVEAIRGSRNTILKYHPRLAISVYHKVDDFRVIPQLILSIRPDYDLYLRHYTEGVIETVMFFIPQK